MLKLNELRKKIDKVDSDIISLLKKRRDLVKEIGKYKKANKIKPLDSNRWNEVLEGVSEKSQKARLSKLLIKRIWNLIHKEALKIEKSL